MTEATRQSTASRRAKLRAQFEGLDPEELQLVAFVVGALKKGSDPVLKARVKAVCELSDPAAVLRGVEVLAEEYGNL